jgi:hypothetical protein
MSKQRVTLPASEKIAEIWRNRGGESVRIEIREYQGCVILDLRIYFPDGKGVLKPSKKGLCFTIRKLPEFARGVSKALTRARELGLIDEADDA